MTTAIFIFFYVSMVANAVVFSALGQGGGVMYTPIQLFFGIEFHVAAATTLFLVMVTSLSSTLVFKKAGAVDWPMAIALESTTTLGGFLGGLYSGYFTGRFLTYLFSGVIAFAAIFMVRSFHPRACSAGRFYLWERRMGQETYCVNLALALPISLIAGLVSGLIGVAGGILKVPMMVLLFGVPMNIAVGSSAFMVGLTATGGFLGHLKAGHVEWFTALALVPGIFIAGQIGARLALRTDKKKMKVYFGYFLFGLAAFLALRAAYGGI